MKEAFEKILERLEESYINCFYLGDYKFNNAIDKAKQIVQEVAEEYNGGWIPCSERLPEENQKVMVQDFYGDITIEKMKINNGTKGFSDGDWWSSANNYLAWQPLSEPYKEV